MLCLTGLGYGRVSAQSPDTLVPIIGLSVQDLGKDYQRDPEVTPDYLYADVSNLGGNTSVRRNDEATLKWKDEGYYQRNRDLGQTFNIPNGTTLRLKSIVLRTGNGDKAILPNTVGAPVQIQFFELEGTPVINDNGTPTGTESTHGFNKNHRTDDYLEGITYKPLALVRGGVFPDIPPTSQDGGQEGHLRYMRWDMEGEAELLLEGGKSYSFIVGFTEGGPELGFTLGNNNRAALSDPPELLVDANGKPWWSIRREGDGTLPPTQIPGDNPPEDDSLRAALIAESLFDEFHETTLSPTTDGFPDVDTYRSHEFYLEVEKNCAAAGTPCDDGDPITENDVADGNCGCAGVNPCQPAGTPCDDGNPNTENDVEDGRCTCAGEVILGEGLFLEALGKTYERDPAKTPDYLFFDDSNQGGSTSVRRVDASNLAWKDEGYFQRNRDLGQTFYIPEDTSITLDAIVMRTGNSSSAVKAGALFAEVYLQLFEVEGTPTINDNGTPPGTDATHGFTKNHRADDYLEGITYKSILTAAGAAFPIVKPTTQNGGEPSHLLYIRWDLLDDKEIILQGGKRYAYLMGFVKPAEERRFTMGNVNRAGDPSPPELATDANGNPWWSIRREGDGTLPPTQYPGQNPPTDPDLLELLRRESLFENAHQFSIPPATDGWPDVDTYRTMEFYIEAKAEATTSTRDVLARRATMKVFPNPAGREFWLNFENSGPAVEGQLLIHDMQGRLIHQKTIRIVQGGNLVSIGAEPDWAPGLLQLSLVYGKEWQSGRVLFSGN